MPALDQAHDPAGGVNPVSTTPFTFLTSYFPGPVAALRTLKSDTVVGLAEPVFSSPHWVSGSFARRKPGW